MTTIATETLALPVPATVIALKGAGKAKREAAYQQIASLAYVEQLSRADTIEAIRAALGKSPTEAEIKAAQQEYIIGRVAARLPATEMLKGMSARDDAARMDCARLLVTSHASPPVEGKAARKLRKGQLGRRSIVQHKVIRAADEAWSLVKAELGMGEARTQAEKNKRATKATPVRGKAAPAAAPTHSELAQPGAPTHSELAQPGAPMDSELAQPGAPMDSDSAVQHVMTQAASLLQFANKHAKHLPTDFGTAIQAFKKACNEAGNAHELRKAARDAG